MLSREARSRVAVVLVGARNPQNIGAAARAMNNFGFSDLRVVNSFAPPFEAAQLEARSAVAADEVMRLARRYTELPEAIADCTAVAGTTAVGDRQLQQPVLTLQDAAPRLLSLITSQSRGASGPRPASHTTQRPARHPHLALLFGSEKTGLTNEQLSHCSTLLTIPMHAPEGRHLSMNLGQSVAVCLYELVRSGMEDARELPEAPGMQATSADRERLLALLSEVLETSGYSRRFPANVRPEILRQLGQPLGSTRTEAATWMGIFRHLLRRSPGSTD